MIHKTKAKLVYLTLLTSTLMLTHVCFAQEINVKQEKSKVTESKQAERPLQTSSDMWVAFTLENDMFSINHKSDDGYTNGGIIAWGYDTKNSFEEVDMPNWIRALSSWTYLNDKNREHFSINYSITQKIYTPTDLQEEQLIEDDRPYAGTLTWTTRIHSFDRNIANSLGLTLGIAGPASLAEQTQKVIHQMTDSEQPRGWDNQISNELVFQIDAEHIRRLYHYNLSRSLQFDTNFYNSAALGNLKSNATTGLSFRIGSNLVKSFAYITPAPARAVNNFEGKSDFNWSLSASAFGSYVFNDVSIDGNTFKESHTAELTNTQTLLSLGLTLDWGDWGIIFSTQKASDAFEGQQGGGYFGGVNIAYHL
ncbi:hypothetical protein CW745_08230 [Psychromonas sp. psych-6C06]|uniref:lipid A deacylase LpxR family protein n=1 Tax=Psychromonas sp. psych-6C06 TaxID=2058089 RepID=UPI000C32FB79|nr:lipid A deacylase LpxR family protein [Psychromonas sp. psych-6C06]PKF61964.1 hypothetical protein CW745_08230 [Psychromonas sp. psych-6C06]